MSGAAAVEADAADVVEAAGHFRIYLGAAAGRRQDLRDAQRGPAPAGRGTDVVIGFVEIHGRQRTEDCIDGLEVVPRKAVEYRGSRLEEMDLDAMLRQTARGRPHR